MTLNVQNSSGTVGSANAYISLAEFKAYHDQRANDYSGKADPVIEAAIVRATDYLDTRFTYRGVKQPTGVTADGTLTATGQFSDGETVTIGGVVYTFRPVASAVNDVRIGGTLDASLTNLTNAINSTGTAGVDYGTGTQPNGSVTATSDATTLTVTAIMGGVAGNSIGTDDTAAQAAWGGTVLSGGSAQTTEWPRMTGGDVVSPVFDNWTNPILLDGTGSILLLVGPDNLPIEGIPPAVKRACAEYAFRALTAPLFQDAPAAEGGGVISEHSVAVDVISETTKFQPTQAGAFALPAFPQADLWLSRAGLVEGPGRVLTR